MTHDDEMILRSDSISQEADGSVKVQGKHHSKKAAFTCCAKNFCREYLWNGYGLVLLGILLLTFFLRLRYITQESIWNDSAVHLWYAIKVISEHLFFFSSEYLLGDYAVPQTAMALFYAISGNALLSSQIVTMLYALVGVFFMYLLGSELRSRFMGLIAAALLAVNHLFWFYGSRFLADSPVLVTTIILLYCVVKLEKEHKLVWGIASGLMFLVLLFTKVQTVIFILAYVLYCLIFKHKQIFNKESWSSVKKVFSNAFFVSFIIPVGFVLIGHVVGKIAYNAAILDRVFGLFLTLRGVEYGFEASSMLLWVMSGYVAILALIGLVLVILYKQKQYYFGLVLFFFYWIFFELNVDNTQDRYMLPLLSIGIVLCAFALEEIGHYLALFIHKYAKYIGVGLIVLFLCWSYYSVGDPLIASKSSSYLGYKEAGEWVRANVPEDAPFFAGEYRLMRFYTQREYGGPDPGEDMGGPILNMRSERYLAGKEAFEEDVRRFSLEEDVYLEVDVWEYAQPKWYYPLSKESFDYFLSLGFKPIYVVERDVATQNGKQKMPVIFIFKLDKQG